MQPRGVVSMQRRLASSQDRSAVSSSPSKKYLKVQSPDLQVVFVLVGFLKGS